MLRTLGAVIIVIFLIRASGTVAQNNKSFPETTINADTRIMSDLFFCSLPEGKVADCLVTFTNDRDKTDPDANLSELGNVIYLAVIDYAQTDDFRVPGQVTGKQRKYSYIFPSDCDDAAIRAQAIADRANAMQANIFVVVTEQDPDLIERIGDRPMWVSRGFQPEELALRRSAVASPCLPNSWRKLGTWYAASAKRATLDASTRKDLMTRSKLMFALADVLAGADIFDIVRSAGSSAKEQEFVLGLLKAQLSVSECR